MFDGPRRPVWLAAVTLLGAAATGALLVTAALPGGAAGTVVGATAWTLWGVMLVAVLVPSAWSLTVLRAASPLHLAAMVVAWVAGASVARAAPGVALGVLFVAAIWSADVGRAFVQASAYGDEQRFPMRPPAAMIVPAVVAWVVWAAALLGAALLISSGSWLAGCLVAAAAVALSAFLLPRWHRFTRRWLVLVPAGVVLHDHMVLGETVMVARHDVRHAALAEVGTGALDLSGPAAGLLIQLDLTTAATVILRNGSAAGRAVHATAVLVAPTRPGAALAAIAGQAAIPPPRT